MDGTTTEASSSAIDNGNNVSSTDQPSVSQRATSKQRESSPTIKQELFQSNSSQRSHPGQEAARESTLPAAPLLPQLHSAMMSRSIRLTKHAARKLLSETACPTCSQALHEPITLPCGHAECLSCIYSRIGADLPVSSSSYQNTKPDGSLRNSSLNPRSSFSKRSGSSAPPLPCSTHVPPRLPLTPSTVPCPDQSCPRSTVGRGLGLWAGHTARYTSSLDDYPEDSHYSGGIGKGASVGPGKPPMDGFVVGLPTHTRRLQVIGAQPRSQAHSFAAIPSSSANDGSTAEAQPTSTNDGLRTDVTLAKAMAVLRRYAGQPTPATSPPRRAQAEVRSYSGMPGGAQYMSRRSGAGRAGRSSGQSRGLRGSLASRRSRGMGSAAAARGLHSSAARTNHSDFEGRRRLIALSSRREEDLESGTASGVRAVWDTDEDEEDEDGYEDAERYQEGETDEDENIGYEEDRESEVEDFHSAGDYNWPADIGGACARTTNSTGAPQQESGSLLPVGMVSSSSGKRGSEIQQADLKRRRRNFPPNSNGANSGRSSQRGRTRIRQVSDVHHYAKRHENVLPGFSVGDDEWDTEEGSVPSRAELQPDDASKTHHSRSSNSGSGGDSVKTATAFDSVPLTRNLSSSSSDIDYNFHSNTQQQDQQLQSQSHSDQLMASKLVDAGKTPFPTDGGIAALQSPEAGLTAMHAELVDVLECQLCYLVLYEPLTSPCGHTFCKTCLARSLDHSERCPLCRTNLPNFAYFSDHPPNASLVKLLTSEMDLPLFQDQDQHHFQPQLNSLYGPQSNSTFAGMPFPTTEAEESEIKKANKWGLKLLFDERKAAVEQEERENRLSTPIFVCTLAFPSMPTVLHVFEPRYRLMIRRCLESGNAR